MIQGTRLFSHVDEIEFQPLNSYFYKYIIPDTVTDTLAFKPDEAINYLYECIFYLFDQSV